MSGSDKENALFQITTIIGPFVGKNKAQIASHDIFQIIEKNANVCDIERSSLRFLVIIIVNNVNDWS